MRRLAICWMAGLLTAIPVALAAQEASDVADLLSEGIVSTPSKTIETASHAAATVSIISAEDLRKYGVRSLDEALNFLAHGVVVTDPAHAKESGARGVLLTGDYNNHFLVLLNGHVLNEGWDGSAYVDSGAGVPFELIDHIEVTLGPGSVMYGSEAMLGVINIVTRKASAFRGVMTVTELDVASPINRAGNPDFSGSFGRGSRMGLGYGQELELFGKPAELLLAAEWRSRVRPAFEVGPQSVTDAATGQPKDLGPRGTRGTWGGWINQSRQERAPSAYAQLRVGDFSIWLRAAEYYRQSAYLDSTINNVGDFDDPRSYERDRWFNADARQRFALGRGITLNVRGFADWYTYGWANGISAAGDCPPELPNGCTQLLKSRVNNHGIEVKSSFDWSNSGRFVTLVGAETRLRQVSSDSGYTDGPSLNHYSMLDVILAAYAEQKFVPIPELEFNLGTRLDHYAGFGVAHSPRASVGMQPWRGGWWKNIYSTAFRAPTIYELNYRDVSQIQNPHLGPEKVWSLESNLEQKLGAQKLIVGIFHTRWNQLIQYASLVGDELDAAIADGRIAPETEFGYQYRNLASLQSTGVETRIEGRVTSRIAYGLSATVARARFDLGDGSPPQPLTVMPSVYGNARLSYQLPEGFPTVAVAGRFENARHADRTFDGGFSNPPRVPPRIDFKLALTGPLTSVRGLTYRLGAGYSLARMGPYVIGPNLYAADESTRAELSPVERLYLFGGLEFAPDR